MQGQLTQEVIIVCWKMLTKIQRRQRYTETLLSKFTLATFAYGLNNFDVILRLYHARRQGINGCSHKPPNQSIISMQKSIDACFLRSVIFHTMQYSLCIAWLSVQPLQTNIVDLFTIAYLQHYGELFCNLVMNNIYFCAMYYYHWIFWYF